ncbi:MAG TPA: hypothetical protein VKI41_19485 [Vicinamibacteria bacterium]|nr:hypothetical protein [Vicinamibacteria bacterium]
MGTSLIQNAVWLAGALLIPVVVVGTLVRRRYRICQTFVLYLGAVLAYDLLVVFWPARFYTTQSWVLRGIAVGALRFGVALELAFRTLRAVPGARSKARGVVLLLLAVTFVTVLAVTGDGRHGTTTAPATFELIAGRIHPRLLSGTAWLFAAIGATILWYRLRVDPFHKAILIGFVSYLLVFTTGVSILDSYGWDDRTFVNYADVGAYFVLMAYWARAAWAPTHDRTASAPCGTAGTPLVEGPFVTVTLWLLLLAFVLAWHSAQIQEKTTRKRYGELMGQESTQMADVTIPDERLRTRPLLQWQRIRPRRDPLLSRVPVGEDLEKRRTKDPGACTPPKADLPGRTNKS